MREKIHPEYKDTVISCACGENIHTKSTKQNIKIEICSKCHPFYTGEQKLIDSAGRVEKFMKKYGDERKQASGKSKSAMRREAEETKKKEEANAKREEERAKKEVEKAKKQEERAKKQEAKAKKEAENAKKEEETAKKEEAKPPENKPEGEQK